MAQHTCERKHFYGQVAIVTGGVHGIGKAIVEQLCLEGAAVAIIDAALDGTSIVSELRQRDFNVALVSGDLESEKFCKDAVERIAQQFQRIDLLVNNAFSFTARAITATREDWQRSFDVGPIGYARLIQNVTPHMAATGCGAIVNIGSISGHIAQAGRWTYSMAKGAVTQLTRCAALDLAKFNIRVNSVSPGWIWTREVEKAANADGGGREKWGPIWGEYHMLRRCGEPIEVARAVLFLLSSDASFITGADLPVDGGYLSMGPEGLGQTAVIAGTS